jgi:uncharacterized protein YukE
MSGEIMARITQMRESAATIHSSVTRIVECLDSVDAEVRSLGIERFTSVAAEEFRSQYLRLTPVLREAAQKMEVFQEKLTSAADEIEVAARPIT